MTLRKLAEFVCGCERVSSCLTSCWRLIVDDLGEGFLVITRLMNATHKGHGAASGITNKWIVLEGKPNVGEQFNVPLRLTTKSEGGGAGESDESKLLGARGIAQAAGRSRSPLGRPTDSNFEPSPREGSKLARARSESSLFSVAIFIRETRTTATCFSREPLLALARARLIHSLVADKI